MSEASGHQGLWTEAKYPGDTVRVMWLTKGTEFGSVRIQHFGEFVKVGAFTPGAEECPDGDTLKVWPNEWETFTENFSADGRFDDYVQRAFADGWARDYSMERNRAKP